MNQQDMVAKVIPVGKVFQLTDPSDGAGTELQEFRLYQTYQVERSRVHPICQKLYKRVFEQITTGSLGDAKPRLIKYVQQFDGSSGRTITDQRTYIVVTRDTLRNTRATAFMRFHAYGEHLYLGIDAYALGGVKWGALIRKCFTTIALFVVFTLLLGFVYSSSGAVYDPNVFVWLIFIFLAFIFFFWWETVRRIIQNKGNILLSLRQAFRSFSDFGTFNVDDVLMFLKPTLHTAVLAVRDVLKEEGLPVETLDAFAQNINVNQTFTGAVGAVVGNVEGNVNSPVQN